MTFEELVDFREKKKISFIEKLENAVITLSDLEQHMNSLVSVDTDDTEHLLTVLPVDFYAYAESSDVIEEKSQQCEDKGNLEEINEEEQWLWDIKFLQYPYAIYCPPRDGDCLPNVLTQAGVEIDKLNVLRTLNTLLIEAKLPTVEKIPSYSTDYGDWLPLAYAMSCGVRLAVVDYAMKRVHLINELATGYTLYLELKDTHFSLYCFDYEPESGFREEKQEEVLVDEERKKPLELIFTKEQIGSIEYVVTKLEQKYELGQRNYLPDETNDLIILYGETLIRVSSRSYPGSIEQVVIDQEYQKKNRFPKLLPCEITVYVHYQYNLWDDGLPLVKQNIQWPGKQKQGRVYPRDYQRKKFASFYGIGTPIATAYQNSKYQSILPPPVNFSHMKHLLCEGEGS